MKKHNHPNPPPEVPTCHPQKSILKVRTNEATHLPHDCPLNPVEPSAPCTSGNTGERSTRLKFDEANIQETFHPADKDYGHIKIDEPPTPYESPRGSIDGSMEDPEARHGQLKPDDVYTALKKNSAEGRNFVKTKSSFDVSRAKHYQSEFYNRAKPEDSDESHGHGHSNDSHKPGPSPSHHPGPAPSKKS